MVEKIDIPTYYQHIEQSIEKDEHESVLKASEKILEANSKEKEANQCKIISLINLGKYDECLKFINKQNISTEYAKEYCYALIESKEYSKCEQFLSQKVDIEADCLQLILAQLNYKTGNYTKSYQILKNEILKGNNITNEDYLTNYLAVYFLSGAASDNNSNNDDLSFIIKNMNSWESFFNYCLILLNQGKFGESMETLLRMESFKTDDEYNDMKYKNLQFSIIQTVFDGFDFSKTTSLQEEYSKLLKLADKESKFKSFQPYFYNNFLHSKKEKDSLNETLKKLDFFLKSDILTPEENFVISINKVILLLRSNKFNEASKEFKNISLTFKNDIRYILVNCYLLIKTDKYEKLEETIKTEYNHIPEVHLILLQTFLTAMTVKNIDAFHEKIILFIKNFFDYSLNYHFINFFISFYETKHLKSQLKEFISNFSNSELFSKKVNKRFGTHPELDKTLFNLIGVTLYKCGSYKEAADFFRLILDEVDSFCKETKLWLLNSVAHLETSLADKIMIELPVLKVDISEDYISNLLSTAFQRQKKDKNITNENDTEIKEKEKKKKKKKVRLPKNFDPKAPLPDKERWLPKEQKKKYKNTVKNKKNYQGAVTDNTTTTSTFNKK